MSFILTNLFPAAYTGLKLMTCYNRFRLEIDYLNGITTITKFQLLANKCLALCLQWATNYLLSFRVAFWSLVMMKNVSFRHNRHFCFLWPPPTLWCSLGCCSSNARCGCSVWSGGLLHSRSCVCAHNATVWKYSRTGVCSALSCCCFLLLHGIQVCQLGIDH